MHLILGTSSEGSLAGLVVKDKITSHRAGLHLVARRDSAHASLGAWQLAALSWLCCVLALLRICGGGRAR